MKKRGFAWGGPRFFVLEAFVLGANAACASPDARGRRQPSTSSRLSISV
ncbi:hypothetical protein BRPE64_ACDS08310 [Caballeronia insecticola]|uniref:Uncharacterized protein n=1 Tax=Caballeronia insecticola TaxID=758793 RepID=R4WNW5_9BURK|nr:hypothetical protein BRPE64_ACDS08310 [Caballeronia insecticola]